MTDASAIREHMEVIGADEVHVGTVDKVEGDGPAVFGGCRDDGGGGPSHAPAVLTAKGVAGSSP